MIDRRQFAELIDQLDYPSVSLGSFHIVGRQAWVDVLRRAAAQERAQLLARLRRHLLCVTTTGRSRLRSWLDAQIGLPLTVETRAARYQRTLSELKYFGDLDVLPTVCSVLVDLPTCVSDRILAACMVLVTGRRTAGWKSGRLPAREPILLAGDRSDQEIAATFRHEAAHAWLEDQSGAEALSAFCRISSESDDRHTYRALAELRAESFVMAWSARP